jgi:hypothetical protein
MLGGKKIKKMRIFPALGRSITEEYVTRYLETKLIWVKDKRYMYMSREDTRYLDGMQTIIYDILKNVLGKDKKDDNK